MFGLHDILNHISIKLNKKKQIF